MSDGGGGGALRGHFLFCPPIPLLRQDVMLKDAEEVASQEIGDFIMKHLKKVDRIAYIRFASVYKKFEEPEDFRRLLLEVKK